MCYPGFTSGGRCYSDLQFDSDALEKTHDFVFSREAQHLDMLHSLLLSGTGSLFHGGPPSPSPPVSKARINVSLLLDLLGSSQLHDLCNMRYSSVRGIPGAPMELRVCIFFFAPVLQKRAPLYESRVSRASLALLAQPMTMLGMIPPSISSLAAPLHYSDTFRFQISNVATSALALEINQTLVGLCHWRRCAFIIHWGSEWSGWYLLQNRLLRVVWCWRDRWELLPADPGRRTFYWG